MFGALARRLFGSANDRFLKGFSAQVGAINELEARARQLSTTRRCAPAPRVQGAPGGRRDARRPPGRGLRDGARGGQAHARPAPFRRAADGRHGAARGMIAEMKTGEGKTLVATLPVYLNALAGKGVHVVTVNDYLARRDAEWMGQIYTLPRPDRRLHRARPRRRTSAATAYACDVTYGTNNEFGFDYLRDNMKFRLEDMVQRPFHYAIVDEVDSILIDEARTPLIISGPTEDNSELYIKVDELIPALNAEDYEKDEKQRTVTLTEAGVEKIEELLRERGPADRGHALRHPQRLAGPSRQPGAARAQAVHARHRLHRQGRQGHHHRRVHRPHDGRPALFRGPAPGARGQGRRRRSRTRTRRWPRSPSRTISACIRSSPA